MPDHFIQIGTRQVWGGEEPFGLSQPDLRQHVYLIGATGVGKSTTLKSLIVQAIADGEGVGVIDPHGDLADSLLDLVAPSRCDDVIYFNPADVNHPIGLNVLARVEPDQRHLVVSGLIDAFKSVWPENWGPRLEHILSHALTALTQCQNVSLLAVPRLLTDAAYRAWVLRQVTDPISLQFWRGRVEAWDARFRNEAIAPVLNKLGRLLLAPITRNVLGQVRSTFDPRYVMDHRKIFIANLSKGKLGADKSSLLGAMLISLFQLAAMQRADVPESQRVAFTTYVDEFPNFATDAFASILSENRKFAAPFVLAHQHLGQLTPVVRDAIFGNVGNWISFRVGESDAIELAKQYGHDLTAEHFSDLGNFEMRVRILQQNRILAPFWGKTKLPSVVRHGCSENIVRLSREKYCMHRQVIEDKIARWMNRR